MTDASAILRPIGFAPPRLRDAWMPLPASATDVELVDAIRRGYGDGIARLVERYSPRLFSYLSRLLDDPTQAEDVLQEVWLRVMERLDGYDRHQPFVVWLFAIARHRAIDVFRERSRQTRHLGFPASPQETEEGELLEPLDLVAADSPSPLDQLAESELEGRMAAAFRLLPAHYREVLSLRFHQDLRLEEIARLLRVPLSTVKTRVQRGLQLLRRRAEGLGLSAYE
jgi:RNA polymerase sigma-70 factor (ECF subfamily)